LPLLDVEAPPPPPVPPVELLLPLVELFPLVELLLLPLEALPLVEPAATANAGSESDPQPEA
jgi:hypothetical protein